MERCHAFKKLLIQSPLMEGLIGHLGQAYYFRAQPTSWTQMQRHDLRQAASPEATCCRAARGWSGRQWARSHPHGLFLPAPLPAPPGLSQRRQPLNPLHLARPSGSTRVTALREVGCRTHSWPAMAPSGPPVLQPATSQNHTGWATAWDPDLCLRQHSASRWLLSRAQASFQPTHHGQNKWVGVV